MTQRRLSEYNGTTSGAFPVSPEADAHPTIPADGGDRLRSPSLHYNGRDVLVLTYIPRINKWYDQRVAKRER